MSAFLPSHRRFKTSHSLSFFGILLAGDSKSTAESGRVPCVIPANGFYEWSGKAGSKQPFYICLPSGEPLAFAGLYEIWEDKEAPPEAGPYKSCTIITMDASDSVKDIHNRMPLILKPEAYEEWLDPANKEPAKIEELLRTKFVRELKSYPVSKLVNRVENNSKACMEALKENRD